MKPHYVVLLGDVGVGKSTIIEKLAGPNIKNRSSNAGESFTLKTEYFETPDGKLLIADTPGSNVMDDTLRHNIQIATTCGSRFWDLDSTTNGIMATSTFNILKDASKTGLEIIKIGQKQLDDYAGNAPAEESKSLFSQLIGRWQKVWNSQLSLSKQNKPR